MLQMNKLIISTKTVIYVLIALLASSCNQQNKEPDNISLFEKISSSHSNVVFENYIPETDFLNGFVYEYLYNGAGVSVGDVNNDGLDDIYFTSNVGANHLYLNEGDFKFKNITTTSNTKGKKGWTTGTNMIDINNDGLLDIYVCKSGPFAQSEKTENELFINKGVNKNGVPVFEELAQEYGLNSSRHSTQSAFFDFDKDGDLDMYLMNHNPKRLEPGVLETGQKTASIIGDEFYINDKGRYVESSAKVGIYSNEISYGLGIGISDLNLDGWPDMYISNDFDEHDYMYINQKNGTFKEVIKKATNHISFFSMGNDIADFDNDGYTDIVTLDMVSEDNFGMKTSMAGMNPALFNKSVKEGRHFQYMYNALQKHSTYIDSTGTPFYSDIAQLTGISNTDWSWAPLMADFDNDGYKDLFITNGIKRNFRDKDFFGDFNAFQKKIKDALNTPDKMKALVQEIPQKPNKNYFYKNKGDLTFENTSETWMKDNANTFSNGAVYADLDNDGDLDLIINNVDEVATILKNNSNLLEKNNYIKLQFNGLQNNTKGIGAKAILYTNKGKQVYENYNVRGYLSSISPNINIGIPKDDQIDSLKIIWPVGGTQRVEISELNKLYSVTYDAVLASSESNAKNKETIFSLHDISADLIHKENDYDDYEHQLLLPHKLSQFGPAIAVGDINGDGTDDIYLGQSTGEASVLFIQNKRGEFVKKQTFFQDAVFEDVDAQFFDVDKDGDLDLYVASGGNEFEENSPNYADRLYENKSGKFIKNTDFLTTTHVSSSKISIADFNKDGYPDVFVGGRHVPRSYPSATSSRLLMNKKGKLMDITIDSAPELQDIGMVTDATWTDYNNDGHTDLIVVGEWMPPMIFKNTNNNLIKVKSNYLDSLSGWYYAIKSLDIDKDGDDDYILGNLGENYKYKANNNEPFEMYYHDFDDNGHKDIVLGYYNFGKLFPVRGKECSSQQVPSIKTITPTYYEFGNATISDIYGENALGSSLHLTSYNFKNGILKNNGNDDFEFIPLPEIAQISSINDVLIKDIDHDKKEDLIIAGNLFTSEVETPRNDASYGMILLNKGNFEFEGLNASKSGLFIPYDVKNLSWIQIKNHDFLISGNNNDRISSFKLH